VLVDAKDADVADVVMATGVHAAGHLQFDLAQVVEVVQVIEAFLDLATSSVPAFARSRNQARAGDHVGEGADVGHGEIERLERLPHAIELALRHIRQHRFWLWVARTRPKLTRSASAASASICAAVMSRHRPVRLEADEHGAVATTRCARVL
jgi:hypothetical protein